MRSPCHRVGRRSPTQAPRSWRIYPDNAALLPLQIIFALGEVLWTHGVKATSRAQFKPNRWKDMGLCAVLAAVMIAMWHHAIGASPNPLEPRQRRWPARPVVSFAAFGGDFGCIETLAGCPALAVAPSAPGARWISISRKFPAGDGGCAALSRPAPANGRKVIGMAIETSDNVSLISGQPHEDAAASSLSYCSISCCASSYLCDAIAFRRVR